MRTHGRGVTTRAAHIDGDKGGGLRSEHKVDEPEVARVASEVGRDGRYAAWRSSRTRTREDRGL